MSITSVSYIMFVAASLMIYWKLPVRFQWILLLADSLIFYFLNAKAYTLIYIVISVMSVYAAAIYFDNNRQKDGAGRKKVLTGTIVLNIGILVALKYTNLFISTYNRCLGNRLGLSLENVSWIASLAVSYYTLQLVAYLIDCYLGMAAVERNPLKLLLFTCYFPLMVSGPISRHSQLSVQLFSEHRFDYDRVTRGLRRMAWGMAKKVVVADRLAYVVNYMYNNTDIFSGIWVIISASAFMVELYFDFSGCMDIIIGVSSCFGITLQENFNAPFLSRTVQEFWQRWHITLGGWLRDYVMYPVSRSRLFRKWGKKCKERWGKSGTKIPYYAAMFIVWSLMGLWHGSSWKYMVGEGWFFWSVIVLGQVFEPFFKKQKKVFGIMDDRALWRTFQVCRTFVLAAIGMIPFRAASMTQTLYMIQRLFVPTGIKGPLKSLYSSVWGQFGGKIVFVIVIVLGILQIICDFRQYAGKDVQGIVAGCPWLVRWSLYFILVFSIILAGAFGQSSFIYFGF